MAHSHASSQLAVNLAGCRPQVACLEACWSTPGKELGLQGLGQARNGPGAQTML